MPVVCLQKPAPSLHQHSTSITSGRIPARSPSRPMPGRSASHVMHAVTKTPHNWHRQLTDMAKTAKAEGVRAAELQERLDSDAWVLVDVRPKDKFAAEHHERALNIPLFDKPENPGKKDMVKRVALALNGVEYVDYNEGFLAAVKAAAAGGKGVIFADQDNGTLVGEGANGDGRASRALKALYLAIDAGVKPVEFLRGELKPAKPRMDLGFLKNLPNALGMGKRR